MISIDIVEHPQSLSSLRDAWNALLVRTNADMPFLYPEWTTSWWEHLSEHGRVQDRLFVHVARDGDRVVGVIPLMTTERRAGFVRARTIAFTCADPYLTEMRMPIVEDAYAVEVARALARSLKKDSDWDWIQWSGLVRGSPFTSALERAFPIEWGVSLGGYILDLPESWETFKRGLKRNIKESLRRCKSSLRKEGLDAKLEVSRDLSIFFDMHSRRAQMENGPHHPDRFAPPRARMFLEDLFAHLGDRACVFLLRVGKEIACARVAFLMPRGVYLYFSGWEPRFGKFSVATTIVEEILKWAIDRKMSFVHLSTGSDVSKARWGPREIMFHEGVTVAPRVRSRAMRGAVQIVREASFARSLLPARMAAR